LETDAENLAEITEKLQAFTTRRLPVMKQLGLV
jgi:hypothetical protein